MNHSTELLECVYQDVKMGELAIGELTGSVKDQALLACIQQQRNGYQRFADQAAARLEEYQEQPREKNLLAQAGTTMGVRWNLIKDGSTPHLAEMMIQGSTMGVVDLSRKIGEFSDADRESVRLARQVVEFEEQNIRQMKQFLGQAPQDSQ